MDYIEEAVKVARRSSIRTHKTGAIIVLGSKIISNGWSHVPEKPPQGLRSLHAEMHALARGRYRILRGATMYVVTISGKSGNIVNGRPCLHCAIALHGASLLCYHSIQHGIPNYQRFHYFDQLQHLKVYSELNGD